MKPTDWMRQDPPPYLPPFLRDFHDAKDFFKTLQGYFKHPAKELGAHTWVSNQIFTVDVFLWFCGIHGYTLQKSRKKGVEFQDMAATLREWDDHRRKQFAALLAAKPPVSAANSPNPPPSSSPAPSPHPTPNTGDQP